jgi:hypothetical protein
MTSLGDILDEEAPDLDPTTIMMQLNAAAVAIDKVSVEIGRQQKRLEGWYEGDTFHPGLDTLWHDEVHRQLERIIEEHEDAEKRLPVKDLLMMRAERRARDAKPDLWADWKAANSTVERLREWARLKGKGIMARQSILKGERQ